MKKCVRGRTLRHLVLACTLAVAASAFAQSRDFDVAAGELKPALDAYIAQAGVQLLYKVSDVKGLSTKGLKAKATPEEALERLLEGTRLKLRRDASGAIVIYADPAEDPKPRAEVSQLEAVVIAATRRREPVREVPMQVNVLRAEALERAGARQLSDYVADQPGVNLSQSGPFGGSLSIRGLTTGSQTVATVGVYVDDVATGSSAPYGMGSFTPLDMGLLDLSHVEILRGPQGTLYGAGAMGGVIKYVTREPDTAEFGGHVRLGVSSTAHGGLGSTASGVINLPLKEDVAAVRVAAFHNRVGGYMDAVGPAGGSRVDRGDTTGARISGLLTPTKDLSVRLSATFQDLKRDGNPLEDLNPSTGVLVEGERNRRLVLRDPSRSVNRLLGLEVEYNFGWARLNAVTSSQTVDLHGRLDISPTYVPGLVALGLPATSAWADSTGEQHRTSQEFRLTSRATRHIDWLVGLYYNRERSTTYGGLEGALANGARINIFTTDKPSTYRELAAYGDVTWHATPQLALTGGVRVGRNKQTFTDTSSGLLARSTLPVGGESAESATTWLATAAYALSKDSNVYVRAASGYRPGGPNGVPPGASAAIKPVFESDSLWSYEAGYKANLLDRTLSVEAALYDIEWSDLQQRISENGLGYFTNAGDARIRGAELTLSWLPAAAWRVDAALSAIDAKLLSDAKGLGAKAGTRLPHSARFSGSLALTHQFTLGGRPANAGANVRYMGARQAGYDGSGIVPAYRLPAYTTVGLQAGVDFQRFSLSAYVRNLTDARGLVSVAYSTLTIAQAMYIEPRTVGVAVNVPF